MEPEPGSDEKKSGANRPEVTNNGAIVERIAGDNNTVIGHLQTTIIYGTSVAHDMYSYAAKIKVADVRMKGVADRIRSTSSILSDIKDLFENFAAQGRDLPHEPLTVIANLHDEMESCRETFGRVKQQIYDVVKDQPSPSIGQEKRDKRELEQGMLTELEGMIRVAEIDIQDHKLNLHIRLSLFSMRLKNQNSVELKDMVADLLKEKASLRRFRNNGQLPPDPEDAPFGTAEYLAAAPAFHPRYKAWKIRRATIDDHEIRPRVQISSWKTPVVIPLAFSNEDLFLQAIGLRAKYIKKGRTHQDVYNELRTQSQRDVIDRLRQQQNHLLQRDNPRLEWTLAGLRPKIRRINSYVSETVSILVILKTELKLQCDNAEPNPLPRVPVGVSYPIIPPLTSNDIPLPFRGFNSRTSPRVEAYYRSHPGKKLPRRSKPVTTIRIQSPEWQDADMTVEEENRYIDSLLAAWDEVVNIQPTREATTRWSPDIATERMKPVDVSKKFTRKVSTDRFLIVRKSRSTAQIELVDKWSKFYNSYIF